MPTEINARLLASRKGIRALLTAAVISVTPTCRTGFATKTSLRLRSRITHLVTFRRSSYLDYLHNIALIYTFVRRKPEQLELDQVRHGGRRPGAGRKPGPNPRIRHRSRGSIAARLPCHVTLRVRDDVPSLRTVSLVNEIERTFAAACDRGGFRLVHYSIQGNHTHLIVEADGPHALAHGMKAIGSRLARAVNRIFRRSGPVLADRYHVHVLRTPREARNALAYVLLNARRHAAKAGRRLARALAIDPASSGRWFDGWTGHLIPCLPSKAAVAVPRTWLLAIGWKGRGLIDPDEIPGGWRV
jgi:REP-associated tyrosine transposase